MKTSIVIYLILFLFIGWLNASHVYHNTRHKRTLNTILSRIASIGANDDDITKLFNTEYQFPTGYNGGTDILSQYRLITKNFLNSQKIR
ncbi:unnamed protein product [Adineta ricciae]|uniref:Uncharacterized protein n=1 Tax=Adineta ricciae TaxID=249248 RepID=A0A814JAL8_ADIRI|nr:unnamed protein product [Adineta ricciae]CAF1034886.1 unnamed protein product [Adineta ricciae]